jgi:ABC-type multidrug transport system permease subunit
MMGRPVIRKQTDYGFYRPAAYQIANALADLPFSALRIFIFNIIIYFMSHLQRSAGKFFAFHLITYFSSYHTAFRVAVAIFPNLVLYAGYMIPTNKMKRWLVWIVSRLPGMGARFPSHHVSPVLHQSSKLWVVSANGE